MSARLTFVRRHGGWLAPALGVAAGWYGATLYLYFAQAPPEVNPSYLPLWATFVAWPAVGLVLSCYTLGLAALLPAGAGYGLWWLACAWPELRRRPRLGGTRAEALDGGRWWVRRDGYCLARGEPGRPRARDPGPPWRSPATSREIGPSEARRALLGTGLGSWKARPPGPSTRLGSPALSWARRASRGRDDGLARAC